jgi:hypothetical protein
LSLDSFDSLLELGVKLSMAVFHDLRIFIRVFAISRHIVFLVISPIPRMMDRALSILLGLTLATVLQVTATSQLVTALLVHGVLLVAMRGYLALTLTKLGSHHVKALPHGALLCP